MTEFARTSDVILAATADELRRERDAARAIAVDLEQQCAALSAALTALTHPFVDASDGYCRCALPRNNRHHRTPAAVLGEDRTG